MGNLSSIPKEVLSISLFYLDHATLYALKYTARIGSRFIRSNKIRITKIRAIDSAISHKYVCLFKYFSQKSFPRTREVKLAAKTGSFSILKYMTKNIPINLMPFSDYDDSNHSNDSNDSN